MKSVSTRPEPQRLEKPTAPARSAAPPKPADKAPSSRPSLPAPDGFARAQASPYSTQRPALVVSHSQAAGKTTTPASAGQVKSKTDVGYVGEWHPIGSASNKPSVTSLKQTARPSQIPDKTAAPSNAGHVKTTRDIGVEEGPEVGSVSDKPSFSSLGQKSEALQALREDPRVFARIGNPLASDPDILFEAARLSAFPEGVLGNLPEAVKQDRNWMMRMVRHNVWALNVVPEAMLKDPKFLTEAAMAFPPILDDAKFSGRREALLQGSPELRERYTTVKKALQELRIDEPMRLRNSELLDEVLRNRQGPRAAGDARPTAVLVYAKQDTDHNGSLKSHNMDELTKHYRVMFYEARTEQDFIDAVKDGGRAGKAELVAVDGHGSRTALNLGEVGWDASSKVREENQIDLGDEAQFRAAGLEKSVAPDATILLEACSNGSDKDKAENPANMFARLFPGREVFAPTQPVEVIKIRLDEQGRVVGPSWTGQDESTYRTHVDPGVPSGVQQG
jgi:hypothetical protein